MAKQTKIVLSMIFFPLFFTACAVKSQTPEATIRVTSFDSEVAVTSELTQIALRNDLDFTAGTVRVNRGFLINVIIKRDNCVVATANSSLSAGFAMVFFYKCKDFNYKIFANEFISEAKHKGWALQVGN